MRTHEMNRDTGDKLKNRIAELVEEHWTKHGKPLLLSDLGSSESGAIGTEAKENSGSLKAYLQGKLSDRVTLVQHSLKHAMIGALPAGTRLDDDVSVDDLLSPARKPKVHSVARYHPAVWAAFRTPLPNDKKRYMSKAGVIRFVDLTKDTPPEGFAKIHEELIDAGDGESEAIESRIQKWADENDLDASRFQLKSARSDQGVPSDDLLGELLDALELEDLRRILMPLDIVRKLRNK